MMSLERLMPSFVGLVVIKWLLSRGIREFAAIFSVLGCAPKSNHAQ